MNETPQSGGDFCPKHGYAWWPGCCEVKAMSETPQEFVTRWLNQVPTPVQEHVREAIRAVLASEAQSAEHIQALLDRAQRAEAALRNLETLVLEAAEDEHAMNGGINSIGALLDEAKSIKARAALREEGKP